MYERAHLLMVLYFCNHGGPACTLIPMKEVDDAANEEASTQTLD